MEKIARSDAAEISPHRYVEGRRPFLITTQSEKRIWATKTGEWPWAGQNTFPIRLGVELIYYALARENKLPMPGSRVLMLRGQPMWGTEILDARIALGKNNDELPAELQARLNQTFQKNSGETDSYLKAVFLDVMLLNNDRTVSNILHAVSGEHFALSYFDHEQSLGWKNDIHVFGRNRIKCPEEEYRDLGTHLLLEKKYNWAKHKEMPERKAVFDSINLESALLDELKELVVDDLKWISPFQFGPLKCGMAAWWSYLRAKPYHELDKRIFGSAD